LIDLQNEPFKEKVIILQWKTVLCIMIGLIESIFRVGSAVITVCSHQVILLSLSASRGSVPESQTDHGVWSRLARQVRSLLSSQEKHNVDFLCPSYTINKAQPLSFRILVSNFISFLSFPCRAGSKETRC
jgi:hypothetical protein